MADRGGIVVKVPAPNTSRRCSACGRGFVDNADTNAARNIDHAAGLAVSGLLSPRP
ncbi:zinc ribbon domain-containing protein [Streptomyces blattellae]|uniref:zinc ribbon domain-containing protein n=1 Tax=Streptomyces blattellae TaxID=2569855 RepID=UPI0038B4BFE2